MVSNISICSMYLLVRQCEIFGCSESWQKAYTSRRLLRVLAEHDRVGQEERRLDTRGDTRGLDASQGDFERPLDTKLVRLLIWINEDQSS